jgi:hypothetical protein
MDRMPFPTQTASARQWLHRPDARIDRIHRALLSTIDGHRTVVELESVARAMRLAPGALEHLREQGFIEMARSTAPHSGAGY